MAILDHPLDCSSLSVAQNTETGDSWSGVDTKQIWEFQRERRITRDGSWDNSLGVELLKVDGNLKGLVAAGTSAGAERVGAVERVVDGRPNSSFAEVVLCGWPEPGNAVDGMGAPKSPEETAGAEGCGEKTPAVGLRPVVEVWKGLANVVDEFVLPSAGLGRPKTEFEGVWNLLRPENGPFDVASG